MTPIEKIILGTVQLGLPYGISNTVGKPSLSESIEILETALKLGIDTIDTASAYGDSADIIGNFHRGGRMFKVITKFIADENFNFEKEEFRSRNSLHVGELECMMFHRFDQTSDPELKTGLQNLKGLGRTKKIGVSIYTNEELSRAIEMDWVDVIQLPFNLLDNMSQRGDLLRAAKQKGKEIHARSVFLQGLFFIPLEKLPPRLVALRSALAAIRGLVDENDLGAFSLHYAVSNPLIDKVIVGVDNAAQLKINIAHLSRKFDHSLLARVDSLKVAEVDLLNPGNW